MWPSGGNISLWEPRSPWLYGFAVQDPPFPFGGSLGLLGSSQCRPNDCFGLAEGDFLCAPRGPSALGEGAGRLNSAMCVLGNAAITSLCGCNCQGCMRHLVYGRRAHHGVAGVGLGKGCVVCKGLSNRQE